MLNTKDLMYSHHGTNDSIIVDIQGALRTKGKARRGDWEEVFGDNFQLFFNDFEIFNGPFLNILHTSWCAIFQMNGIMVHGLMPSQSLEGLSLRINS